jgi:hypothetical protein
VELEYNSLDLVWEEAKMTFSMGMGATFSESAGTLLQFALLPIGKVFVMCSLGLLMATSYVGILTASARKELTKVYGNNPPFHANLRNFPLQIFKKITKKQKKMVCFLSTQ